MDYRLEYIQVESNCEALEKQLKIKKKHRHELQHDPLRNNSRIIQLDGELSELYDELAQQQDRMNIAKTILKSYTKNLDNLEYQVFYYRYIRKQSLKTIAKKLHYSYSHIKRISAQLSRKVGV